MLQKFIFAKVAVVVPVKGGGWHFAKKGGALDLKKEARYTVSYKNSWGKLEKHYFVKVKFCLIQVKPGKCHTS